MTSHSLQTWAVQTQFRDNQSVGVCFKPIYIYSHIIKGVGVTKYADCWSYEEKGTFYDSLIVEHVTLINDPSLIINFAAYENMEMFKDFVTAAD